MIDKPKISVIIPVYNVENWIIKCVDSVINQDVDLQIEIIIVDDCSPDNSIQIIKDTYGDDQIINKSRTLSIVSHSKNKGLAAARNTGVRNSNGEYIYFLDSDDYITHNCLSILYDEIIKSKFDIIEAQSSHISENGELLKNESLSKFGVVHKNNIWEIGKSWMPICWNKLIKKEFFIKKNLWLAEGFFYEDLYWAALVAIAQPKIKVIPDQTHFYLVRNGSITNSKLTHQHIISFIRLVSNLSRIVPSDKQIRIKFNKYYEGIRTLTIDNAFPFCTSVLQKELLTGLQKYNINSLYSILHSELANYKLISKILPLYCGRFGYYLIKFKASISKLFKA